MNVFHIKRCDNTILNIYFMYKFCMYTYVVHIALLYTVQQKNDVYLKKTGKDGSRTSGKL